MPSIRWDEVLNVTYGILLANSIAAILICGFILFGQNFSLDNRVFPKASRKQELLFGFTGFYLLALSGLEVLNPLSFSWMRDTLHLTYVPGFLGIEIG
ncbi:MAG: hypothetical protein HZB19_14020 [Chloroflexi bacterium]|nr:hypothetical protein [Chloroflexota bacterium]